MSVRSHSEFSKRMRAILAKPVPCPECGMDLPATDDDVRREHFKVCAGKPKPAAPKIAFDAHMLTTDELRALRLNMRTRLTFHQNPGGSFMMASILSDVMTAIDAELTVRGDA
jgi:hypothetical protein